MIALGDADVMLAGGTESPISPIAITGFARAKALATSFNHPGPPSSSLISLLVNCCAFCKSDKPNKLSPLPTNSPCADSAHRASRPFSKDRQGFVIGEGAAIVVLEELGYAKRRGAPAPLAELKGYGLSGDAYHITQPAPDGRGAVAAMKAAMSSARVSADQIDYVNAHATSTPLGDAIEASAISHVLGKHRVQSGQVLVSSTKGSTGHLLGAAGALESVFTIAAISTGMVPPTINLDAVDPEIQQLVGDLVPNRGKPSAIQNALCNSFGFGGTNASLLFSAVPREELWA